MSSKVVKMITVPGNGQISIGKAWAGRQIRIVEENTNEIHISAGIFIPDSQQTFFTKDAENSLHEFNQYERTTSPVETDTDSLFSDLRKKKKSRDK